MLRSLLALATLAQLSCAAPAPQPPPPSPPAETDAPAPPPRATMDHGCNADTDCPTGKVCEGCGGPKECVPGCHQSSQCPGGAKCHQVQCIRCPCPGQCMG